MSQTTATKLISKLRFKIHDRRKLRNPDGPKGRHEKIKKTLTALLRHERIELNYHRADETRGYAERLISEAIRNGDRHTPTMEMASYWIIEPPIVHKLFKVLAPRYSNFEQSYTKLWRAPNVYPGHGRPKCVLELRNNIYPPLEPDKSHNKNLIHNVLLEEAKKAYRKEKAKIAEMEKKLILESKAKESAKTGWAVDGNVDSDTTRLTVGEQELSSEENLKADSENQGEVSGGESIENVKAESSKDSESGVKNEASSIEADVSQMKMSEVKSEEAASESEVKNKASSIEADISQLKISEKKPEEAVSESEKK